MFSSKSLIIKDLVIMCFVFLSPLKFVTIWFPMCSDFWFNSESALTDARLPAALSVLRLPLPEGGVGCNMRFGEGARVKATRVHTYISSTHIYI